jgi:O-antigen/teichoic acid export membrane protein
VAGEVTREPPPVGHGTAPTLDQAPAAGSPHVITSGPAILGGGAWKVASVALPQLYVLVLSVTAARFLGPTGMGRQSFIAFVESAMILLLAQGLPTALMRQVGEAVGLGRPAAVRSLTGWAWRLEAGAALVGGGLLAGAAALGADPRGAWLFAGVACALGILHCVPSALLIGLQRWREATVAGIVTGLLATVGTIAVLSLGGGITGMFAVEAASSAIVLVWTAALARRALGEVAPVGSDAPDLRSRTIRVAWLASLGAVLELVVWKRSEFFFLNWFSDDAELAYYSIAFGVAFAIVRLPATLAAVAAPAVANLFGAGEVERIRRGFGRGLRLLSLGAFPIVALALALGPTLITAIWGAEYERAGDVFLIMAVASLALPVADLSYSLLVGIGRLRIPLLIDGCAALCNVALALLLIPRYGAVGAALANSGAQVAVALPLSLYVRRVLGSVEWHTPALLRGAVASAAAGLVAFAVLEGIGGNAALVPAAVAGTAVFLGLGIALRVLPREDAAWLGTALGRRLGPRSERLVHLFAPGRP